MCSIKKYEKWLLIEKSNGTREVVNVRSLFNSAEEQLAIGSKVTLAVCEDEDKSAKIIAAAREAQKLEHLLNSTPVQNDITHNDEEKPAPDQEENGDFSASEDSSWAPSESSSSSEASEPEQKNPNIRKYFNRSGRVLTPCTRVNAIIPNVIPPKQKQYTNTSINGKNQKQSKIKNITVKNEISSNREDLNKSQIQQETNNIEQEEELAIINNLFFKIFKLLREVKTQKGVHSLNLQVKHSYDGDQNNINSSVMDENGNQNGNETIINSGYQDQSNADMTQENVKAEELTIVEHMSEDEYARSEDSNRSDDNVLISNKYAIVDGAKPNVNNIDDKNKSNSQIKSSKSKSNEEEWIPIGSGQTLVHKDQFKKINWRSYTMATRTLLLAVFPRQILATHSLTGKKSPAFQNKPAKMCLDPRTIQDVIIEITDRFNVKENLVRTIITTKCADECKMMKIKKEKIKRLMELKNKNKRSKTKAYNGKEDANQTC